ncbi:MAG: Rv1355c family protein [Nitrososphaerales archaeon]
MSQLHCQADPGLTDRLTSQTWRPIILDCDSRADRAVAEALARNGAHLLDRLQQQRAELTNLLPPVGEEVISETPRYVYYPWRRELLKVVGPNSFDLLRLDRNRNKITPEEQGRFRELRVGVVGLSVGHSIAHLLATQGLCGELRLADFDELALTNLNRVPATILDVGTNKALVASRRIAEIDPYLKVEIWPNGVHRSNIGAFLDGLDVVIEECDSLDVKVLLREGARARRIPVLMETTDRGLLDVERYDVQPERPLFHGLLRDVSADAIAGLSTHDKVPYVLQILEADQVSPRGAASLAEVGETLETWPQLASDVALGAATITTALLHLIRDGRLPSGRVRVDLEATIGSLSEPSPRPVGEPEEQEADLILPSDPRELVAFAASRAPSGGNVQPWRFSLNENSFQVFLDPSKSVTMDVHYRGSYVAIGASLFNARAAAAGASLLGPVDLFPESGMNGPVAVLRFGSDTDDALSTLLGAVFTRSANRQKGTREPIGPQALGELARAATDEGSQFHIFTDRSDIEVAADLLAESDRLRFLTPDTHREMFQEIRWPGLHSLESGIDVRSLELEPKDLAALEVAKRPDVMELLGQWEAGTALGEHTRKSVRSSSALAVVTVRGSKPGDFVRCGQAIMRVWLTAELAGLAVHPTSPLFIYAHTEEDFHALVGDQFRARLRALANVFCEQIGLGEDEHIGLVLRLSKAPKPSVRSRRIPLDELVTRERDLRRSRVSTGFGHSA